MVLPAVVYLGIFFVYRCGRCCGRRCRATRARSSSPLEFDWAWSNYGDAFTDFRDQIVRSFVHRPGHADLPGHGLPAGLRDRLQGGPLQEPAAGLVILPFFVTFLVRTLAWKTILADDGWVVSAFDAVGLLPQEGRLLSTSWGVVGGLVYNFLPFMVLPLYVSLEKIDPAWSRRPATSTRRLARLPQGDRAAVDAGRASPAACSCSSPPRATSSTPSTWAAPRTR